MSRSDPRPLPAVPGEAESTLAIPGRAALAVRRYGVKRTDGVTPLVLHFHGGAFIDGDLDTGACLARLLARAGAVVISVAYPLAPEHRFPEAVEAGYAALEVLHRQRRKLAGTGCALLVAGEEAGGNLAAAVALVARDRAGPPLAGQILVAPMLDPCTGSAAQREAMACTEAPCKWSEGWKQYLRGPMDAEHPYAVPARALRLAGLPPTLVLTGPDDVMRDEALAYAARLRDAGIAVTSQQLPVATGWPQSLAEPDPQDCPCSQQVEQQLRAFFQAAIPPPS